MQIVYSSRRGSRSIEHLGSAHDDGELEAFKAAARQQLTAGQGELDLGLPAGVSAGGPLEIASSRMGHLHDALFRAYDMLGFDLSTPVLSQKLPLTGQSSFRIPPWGAGSRKADWFRYNHSLLA